MKTHPFKVKKSADSKSLEFRIELPTTMVDKELIIQRYGSVERMIDRANGQLIVDVAPGMRKRLPDMDEAQRYALNFCANGSKDSFRPKVSKDAQKEQRFSKSQLEFLASIGTDVEK